MQMKRLSFDRVFIALMPLISVVAALLVGAVILLLLDVNPLEAYQAMFVGAFGSKNGLADTLVKATPLLLVVADTLWLPIVNVISFPDRSPTSLSVSESVALTVTVSEYGPARSPV